MLAVTVEARWRVGVALGVQGPVDAGVVVGDGFCMADAAVDLRADRLARALEGRRDVGVALGAGGLGVRRACA